MKYIQTKKIIITLLLIFVFSPVAFSHAETVEVNGITFVVGKHEPEKRVHKAPRKYKNPKALEVHKQPAHGRKLKLEETEEYIEAHKNDIVVNNDINVNLPKTLEDFQLQKSEKGTLINKVVSSIIDVLKKILSQVISLQKNILNFSERLSLIEKKLGIESQDNLTNNNQASRSDSDESIQDENYNENQRNTTIREEESSEQKTGDENKREDSQHNFPLEEEGGESQIQEDLSSAPQESSDSDGGEGAVQVEQEDGTSSGNEESADSEQNTNTQEEENMQ